VLVEDVDVGGSFKANDTADIESIDVGGTVRLSGGRVARILEVGGSLKSSEPLEFGDLDVGGTISLSGGEGGDISVGGTLRSDGELRFKNINVGGTVKIDGDAEGENVSVGGTCKVYGNLSLSERLRVGGRAAVDGHVKADSIRVGGKLEAYKAEAEKSIEASVLRTRHGAKATRIEIGRKGEVRGPLIGQIVVAKERSELEDVWADEIQLRSRARAGHLYGRRVHLEHGCEVEGVTYTEELRSEPSVRMRNVPQKAEKLPDPPF
jgi:cytoskeletal protein CcmA (bactofilin family)